NFKMIVMLALAYLCLFTTPIFGTPSPDQNTPVRNVLLLNSYQKGYVWTDDITAGVTDTFLKGNAKVNVMVEYLDWKNYPTQESLKKLYDLFQYKYQAKKIDALLVSDDAALDFAMKYRKEIFSDAPIVFCGIFQDRAQNVLGQTQNITGVVESIDVEGTLAIAMKMFPQTQKIFVVHDLTESGLQSFYEAYETAKTSKNAYKVFSWNDMYLKDNGEVAITVPADYDQNSLVLLTSFTRDKQGQFIIPSLISQSLSDAVKTPVFSTYNFYLDHGILGGKLLSGEMQGSQAALYALRILGGESAATIPLYTDKTTAITFDAHMMLKHKVQVNQLPINATMINNPFSFYQSNKLLIWIFFSIMLMLLYLVFILTINVLARKRAEVDLKSSNDQLAHLYNELTQSDEQLKSRFEELAQNRTLIEKNEARYRTIFESSNEGLLDINLQTNEVFFNNQWQAIHEDSISLLDHDQWLAKIHPADKPMVQKFMQCAFSGQEVNFILEYRFQLPMGQYKWIYAKVHVTLDDQGKASRITAFHSDIHEKKLQEERITQLAYYDPLTGLPNRTAVYEFLQNQIDDDEATTFALFFIDTDNFKMVNDSFGHTIGDALVKAMAHKLSTLNCSPDAMIGRIGGDEFILCIRNLQGTAHVVEFADKIVALFNQPFTFEQFTIHITASVGIALYPNDGLTVVELTRNADAAMYKAKELGKNGYVFFNQEMYEEVETSMRMQMEIRHALKNNQFELHYQPIIKMAEQRISQFEALLRWKHPERGYIPPLTYIKIAEESGLILPIGKWVLRNACEFSVRVNANRQQPISVAVNMSALELAQSQFVNDLMQIIQETGVNPETISLELTETAVIKDFETNIQKLHAIRKLGIKISLDDFGTGYSSFNYLKKLPVDVVKIDKSFVDNIVHDALEFNLTAAFTSISHHLGCRVVAEGVETVEQMDKLLLLECDYMQGYYFSRPVPEANAIALLA
ncbi:MAG: EAL domain-containing protein, partial [Hyphomonadaceae bacterium]|nr:EAL domain-containing protein [Clostridia bacterium]